MEHRIHRTHTLVATLLAVAAVTLTTGPAQASRLPADPLTFVGTPAPMADFVLAAQADHVRAALEDIHAG